MNLNLHRHARTTPAIRQELRESTKSERELAREYNLNRATLSPVQEQVVVALRQTLLLPLDDLLAVTREFIHPAVSRSGLDRCLRRHGVSNLSALIPQPEGEAKPVKTFKDYEPGFVHIDVKYLPQMPDEAAHQYLFVAIDRASRWVYVEILPEKTATNARDFLRRLIAKAPFKIEKILTDNSKEFTDRFCATGEREPTGRNLFDQGCAHHGIEHRLIAPVTRRPMGWWNASTGASPRCSPPPASIPRRTSRTPSAAMCGYTITRCRRRRWDTLRRFKHSRIGNRNAPNASKSGSITSRELTFRISTYNLRGLMRYVSCPLDLALKNMSGYYVKPL